MNKLQAKIWKAMIETQRYIDLESPRPADTRPDYAVKLLAKYKDHLVKLEALYAEAA